MEKFKDIAAISVVALVTLCLVGVLAIAIIPVWWNVLAFFVIVVGIISLMVLMGWSLMRVIYLWDDWTSHKKSNKWEEELRRMYPEIPGG